MQFPCTQYLNEDMVKYNVDVLTFAASLGG